MSFDLTTLITDRTAANVKRLLALKAKNYADMTDAERAEWDTDLKGAYNASDLNRITNAMLYLKGLYEHYGYPITYTPVQITHVDGTTDTTWRREDIPTDTQLATLVQNLYAFWAAAESADGEISAVWADTEFGYVEMPTEVVVGDYVSLTEAHGIRELRVSIQSEQLGSISVSGTGWTVQTTDSALTAVYTVPSGVFQDLQSALDSLVLICTAEDLADATATVSALLRSGAVVQLGSGAVHWSAIINWMAFDAYGYTWQDVEDRQMTWDELEHLPIPRTGGGT